MSGQIRINYEEMRAVSNDFRQQSDAVQQILNTLNGRANQLMAGWEGVAEQTFMQELEQCRQRLVHMPEMLAQISQALIDITQPLAAQRTCDKMAAIVLDMLKE